jgi:long-chain acyl-CoA synthetase
MNNTSQQTITRVFELLPRYVAHYNLSDALAVKENGDWRTYSAQEFIDNANAISLGLLKIGLGKNDKVAVISSNRPEWNFVDFGTQQIGGVLVPMYPTITVEEYRFIFQDASVKVIFVEGKLLYDKVQEAIKEIEGIEAVYLRQSSWSKTLERNTQFGKR